MLRQRVFGLVGDQNDHDRMRTDSEVLSNVVDVELIASFGRSIHAASFISIPSAKRTPRITLSINS
jgi:hypothetical protein